MELEGLDNEIDTTDFEKPLLDLPKLKWYLKEKDGDAAEEEGSASKKARIE